MQTHTLHEGGNSMSLVVITDSRYRYTVEKVRMINENGEMFTASFIVIKNHYNVIVSFTRLEIFAIPFKNKPLRKFNYANQYKLEYICKALNFVLIDNRSKYEVDAVSEISASMVLDFFDWYCDCPKSDGEYRGKQSITNCIDLVSRFFSNVALCAENNSNINSFDLMEQRFTKKSLKSQIVEAKYLPSYEPRFKHSIRTPILRDIPFKAMDKLLELCKTYYPEIYFALICQISAGLRPSEAMNVRQENSPLGPGLYFTMLNSKVTDIAIDLKTEYLLRSDGIKIGGIKKKRMQHIHPKLIPLFMEGLNSHKVFLKSQTVEKEFMPMFVNRDGKAMTYPLYLKKFHALIQDYLRPALLESDNQELKVLGLRLVTEKLSPHALRHFFTVLIVLMTNDIAQVQYYRGDKSPDSALWYMQNKGALVNAVAKSHSEALLGLINVGRSATNTFQFTDL